MLWQFLADTMGPNVLPLCRHLAVQCLMACGVAVQILSALLLGQEKQLWRHEMLKARCFIVTIILGMVHTLSFCVMVCPGSVIK